MLLNADVSSLVSLPIMDAVRRTYRLTTPRTLHHWGNGLGMELSAKKTELRRRRGLLITPDGTVKPRAGARFLGDLGSSCCFVYSAYRLRFHFESPLPGKPVPTAPCPRHLCLRQPGCSHSLPWPLLLNGGLSSLPNFRLPTQITTLKLWEEEVGGPCILLVSQLPSPHSGSLSVPTTSWLFCQRCELTVCLA